MIADMDDDAQRVSGYTRHEYGDRIGATARLRAGATAAVLDGDRLLLTKRTDNGEWCLPGGGIDAGERPAEAAEREVFEETGLTVRVTGLLGVYSNPDVVVVYPDGERVQVVGVLFRAEPVAGVAGTSNEVSEAGWFTQDEAAELTLVANHRPLMPTAFGAAGPYFDPPVGPHPGQ
jgi:8-oxo-dGTP pyrophosphatase MutT (NUDIX family)